MDKNEIKELRDFGIQLLTIGCLSPGQVKRLCELIGDTCERVEELEQAVGEALALVRANWKANNNHPASRWAKEVEYFEQALKGGE